MTDTRVPVERQGVPEAPPSRLGAMLMRLGPGIILAGAIVGSGELIATTKVGAEAGFWLLWLIVIGCILKVFTQVEIGRYTVTWGRTSLEALDILPGPRYRVNWVLWYWFATILLIISQNGGIVGGVGQALAIFQPLTDDGAVYNDLYDQLVRSKVEAALVADGATPGGAAQLQLLETRIESLTARVAAMSEPADIAIWAGIMAVATSALMYVGRYQLIQSMTTVMVGTFTVVTIATVFMLQSTDWAVGLDELALGFQFRLPPENAIPDADPVGTALAAFGMIGLSAGELIMYPYWCLEKGYAQATGPRDNTPAWAERARGWMRIMRLDAWLSMVIYTFATIAFYILGAAVLSRSGLNVEGEGLIRTLAEMYVPVLGPWAEDVFLIGAATILYSTYFVFAAGFARIIADSLILLGLVPGEDRRIWIRRIGVALPLIALVVFLFIRAPVAMVLAAGLGQATLLPVLGAAALYFRYKRLDARLTPSMVWDVFLWLSVAGLFVVGVWSIINFIF